MLCFTGFLIPPTHIVEDRKVLMASDYVIRVLTSTKFIYSTVMFSGF